MLKHPIIVFVHHKNTEKTSLHNKKNLPQENTKNTMMHWLAKLSATKRTDLAISQNQHGKKWLSRIKHQSFSIQNTPIHFSITHNQKLSAIAFSNKPIGIDIEKVPKQNTKRALLKKLLSHVEQKTDHTNLNDIEKNIDLITQKVWTTGESWAKLNGIKLWDVFKNNAIPYCHETTKSTTYKVASLKHHRKVHTQYLIIQNLCLCIMAENTLETITFIHHNNNLHTAIENHGP